MYACMFEHTYCCENLLSLYNTAGRVFGFFFALLLGTCSISRRNMYMTRGPERKSSDYQVGIWKLHRGLLLGYCRAPS